MAILRKEYKVEVNKDSSVQVIEKSSGKTLLQLAMNEVLDFAQNLIDTQYDSYDIHFNSRRK